MMVCGSSSYVSYTVITWIYLDKVYYRQFIWVWEFVVVSRCGLYGCGGGGFGCEKDGAVRVECIAEPSGKGLELGCVAHCLVVECW